MCNTATKHLFLFVLIQAVLVANVLCVPEEGPICNIVCGRDYNPVCGEYQGIQKTFSNLCMMNYYNCLKGTEFVYLQKGECSHEEQEGKLK